MGTSKSSFDETDSPEFVALVGKYLSLGAHTTRGVDEATYVAKCRETWNSIETDDLYRLKFLDDEFTEGSSGNLYGVAVAEIHAFIDDSGTQWNVPFDYAALRKPLGAQRRELIFVYPPDSSASEAEQPEKETVLLALFDVLGFEALLRKLGLDEMHRRYDELIHRALVPSVAEGKLSLAAGMFACEFRQGYLRLPVRFAYFSDTILLWARCHEASVGPFLDRCSSLFCNALNFDFPLRGAISLGEAVCHRATNTFLGMPLVEAARLESAQNSIGVALGVSVRAIPLPPNRIIRFEPSIKPGREHFLSGLVLDWPRHWRDFHQGSAESKLAAMRTEPFEKYDGALAFVEYSVAHENWFLDELPEQLRGGTPVDARNRFGRA